jgi:hypothetical protein
VANAYAAHGLDNKSLNRFNKIASGQYSVVYVQVLKPFAGQQTEIGKNRTEVYFLLYHGSSEETMLFFVFLRRTVEFPRRRMSVKKPVAVTSAKAEPGSDRSSVCFY